MTTNSAQEAIAALLDLAERGEINPWDVQVIEVIDRFLEELGLPHDLELAYQQANLPRSGQAFLWASLLVRLKADTLEPLAAAEEEEETLLADWVGEEREPPLALSGRLESHLRRRSSALPPRRRRVTLSELIAQLEQIAAELDEAAPASTRKRPRLLSHREAVQAIAELAHQENLTAIANQLEQFLQVELPRLAPQRQHLDLEELFTWWQQSHPPAEGESGPAAVSRASLFWALLLLCSQSKVHLSQKEFYQDLTVQVL
jgi:segregation and condensation protein A